MGKSQIFFSKGQNTTWGGWYSAIEDRVKVIDFEKLLMVINDIQGML